MSDVNAITFGEEGKVAYLMLVANNPVVISEEVIAIKQECNRKVEQLKGYGYKAESKDSADGYLERVWMSKADKKAKNGKKWVVVGYKSMSVV